jgi:sec-independent protein translocase protein TatA
MLEGKGDIMIGFSVPELLVILGISLVVFGPGKLPEVGKAVGKSIQEFKKAMSAEETKQVSAPKEEKAEEKKS